MSDKLKFEILESIQVDRILVWEYAHNCLDEVESRRIATLIAENRYWKAEYRDVLREIDETQELLEGPLVSSRMEASHAIANADVETLLSLFSRDRQVYWSSWILSASEYLPDEEFEKFCKCVVLNALAIPRLKADALLGLASFKLGVLLARSKALVPAAKESLASEAWISSIISRSELSEFWAAGIRAFLPKYNLELKLPIGTVLSKQEDQYIADLRAYLESADISEAAMKELLTLSEESISALNLLSQFKEPEFLVSRALDDEGTS